MIEAVQDWIPFEADDDEMDDDEDYDGDEVDDEDYNDDDEDEGDDASEQDFREDLADHLRNWNVDGHHHIIEESGLRRSRNDIWVRGAESGKIVLIELKVDLDSSSELNRLLGQIVRHGNDADAIVIVLVYPDENILEEFRLAIQNLPSAEKIAFGVWE